MPDPAVSIEDAVKAGIYSWWREGLSNDFETVTNLPGVGDIKRIMEQNKALGCRMTGSGSAVFAIFSDRIPPKVQTALQSGYRTFLCLPDRRARVERIIKIHVYFKPFCIRIKIPPIIRITLKRKAEFLVKCF